MRQLADRFKALADETRLQILTLILHRGEMCVCDVVGVLGITQSKASRHLRYLSHAGLLVDRRDGAWVHYAIPASLDADLEILVGAVRGLLPTGKTEALTARFDAWMARKADATACSVV